MTAFSRLQQRVNAVVLSRTADTQLTLAGVADVPAILQPGLADFTLDQQLGGAGTAPTVALLADAVAWPARIEGMPVLVQTGPGAGAYKVASYEPDGAGMYVLTLFKP